MKHQRIDVSGDLLDDLDLIILKRLATAPGIGFREIFQTVPPAAVSEGTIRYRLNRMSVVGLLECRKVLSRYDTWFAPAALVAAV